MGSHLTYLIGGASAASEATLSSCPLRFAVYVGGFSTCNQSQLCGSDGLWQIKRSRVRFPHWNFFFSLLLPFFFCLSFSLFFFLHVRSAISMLKHFSSIKYTGDEISHTRI